MKKIYISIPISGKDVEKQKSHADAIKGRLSRQGYAPISPFDIYAGKNPSYEDYIAADLQVLMKCDGIYMCHGWKLSCGCIIEHSTATALDRFGKRKFQFMEEA